MRDKTTVLCVLRSGGEYTVEWVRKLRDAVERNTTKPHIFECLSDVETPCSRQSLMHDWPGWWSKIELFHPHTIAGPTLYIDLDTVIVGNIDHLLDLDYDFAMLTNFHQKDFVGSGVMWFRNPQSVPHKVYHKFARMPDAYIAHHQRVRKGPHMGDQAFVWDTLGGQIAQLDNEKLGLKSYKYHCSKRLPPDARAVCFHGPPRLGDVRADWIEQHWV